MFQVRPALLAQDRAAILALDVGFETDSIFRALASPAGFVLAETPVAGPIRKVFALDDLEAHGRPWDQAWVAVEGGEVRGFAASGWQAWNKRAVLWHFYVDRGARGRGLGRALLQPVLGHAMALGARHLWLETSNLNVPGVAAYRRLGFELTGLDLTLYDGGNAEGEFALFMSRPVA